MGKDKNKDKEHQDGEPQLPPRMSPALRMSTSPTETSAGTGKQGMLP